MSAVYKTIAKARELAAKMLQSPNHTKSSITSDMGVSFSLFNDIMEDKPLLSTMTIRKEEDQFKVEDIPVESDPLSELDLLVEKFAKRGYKLETRILRIQQE